MNTEREMTLDEFLQRELPEFHLARQQLGELRAKYEACQQRSERLLQEAEIQAQEARTYRAIVQEIYQVVTGGTGEPGTWHGGEPVRKLGEQHQAMAAFVNEAINACFDGGSLDGAWIQERGEELGLLEAVEYDPALHNIDSEMTEPGDTIYVRAAWLGTKSEEPRS